MGRDRQRVPINASPQQPPRSRPLRTGKEFVLVLAAPRIIARRWDKARYQPGGECRLSVIGAGLGKAPLSITVEAEANDGSWTAVAKLHAETSADQKEAVAHWRFPAAPVVPGATSVCELDGSMLTEARFEDRRDLEEGGTVWMVARAEGFEGRSLQIVLEREGKPGEWVAAGQGVATVRSGAARSAVTPDTDQTS